MLVINWLMVRQVDAIFSGGAFRPLQPLVLPEGTRVRLSVEEAAPRVHSARSLDWLRFRLGPGVRACLDLAE